MNMSGNNLSTYLQVQYLPWVAQTINIYSVFQMKLHIDALGNMSTEFIILVIIKKYLIYYI